MANDTILTISYHMPISNRLRTSLHAHGCLNDADVDYANFYRSISVKVIFGMQLSISMREADTPTPSGSVFECPTLAKLADSSFTAVEDRVVCRLQARFFVPFERSRESFASCPLFRVLSNPSLQTTGGK